MSMARVKGRATKIIRVYADDVALLEQIRRGIVVIAHGRHQGMADAFASVLQEAIATGLFDGQLEAGREGETDG